MSASIYQYRIVSRNNPEGKVLPLTPWWPEGEYVYSDEYAAISKAKDFNRLCGSPALNPRLVNATYKVKREHVIAIEPDHAPAPLNSTPTVTQSHSARTDPRNPAYNVLQAAESVVRLFSPTYDLPLSPRQREALESLKAAIEEML